MPASQPMPVAQVLVRPVSPACVRARNPRSLDAFSVSSSSRASQETLDLLVAVVCMLLFYVVRTTGRWRRGRAPPVACKTRSFSAACWGWRGTCEWETDLRGCCCRCRFGVSCEPLKYVQNSPILDFLSEVSRGDRRWGRGLFSASGGAGKTFSALAVLLHLCCFSSFFILDIAGWDRTRAKLSVRPRGKLGWKAELFLSLSSGVRLKAIKP